MPTFDPGDLIGRTFLLPPEENGERNRAKVTREVVEIIVQENGHRIENINFILDIGNGKVEELISYNQLLEQLKLPKTMIWVWIKSFLKFRAIIGQQGPFGSNRSRLEGQQRQCSSGMGDWWGCS